MTTLRDLLGSTAPRPVLASAATEAASGTGPVPEPGHGDSAGELGRLAAAALARGGAALDRRACAYFVPGRIEVLGKHTDYGGGRSLLSALTRGFCVVAIPRDDTVVTVTDAIRGDTGVFSLDPKLPPAAGWKNYAATVARRTARDFAGKCTGADLAFASNLPIAAGMSSSSALVVGLFLALSDAGGLTASDGYRTHLGTPQALAGYLAALESGYGFGSLAGDRGVGTQGGSEDHTAMLCARAGRLVQFSFAPIRFEAEVPVPAGHLFALAASGVQAEKTGAARERYNRASTLLRVAAELWRAETGGTEPHVAAILRSAPDAAERLRRILDRSPHPAATTAELLERVQHFAEESEKVIPAATTALATGDLAGFGRHVARSHELAERLLHNQTPETMALVRLARRFGAVAASAFGAGFGGSVWALVTEQQAARFLADWREAYLADFTEHAAGANFFLSTAGPPARQIT